MSSRRYSTRRQVLKEAADAAAAAAAARSQQEDDDADVSAAESSSMSDDRGRVGGNAGSGANDVVDVEKMMALAATARYKTSSSSSSRKRRATLSRRASPSPSPSPSPARPRGGRPSPRRLGGVKRPREHEGGNETAPSAPPPPYTSPFLDSEHSYSSRANARNLSSSAPHIPTLPLSSSSSSSSSSSNRVGVARSGGRNEDVGGGANPTPTISIDFSDDSESGSSGALSRGRSGSGELPRGRSSNGELPRGRNGSGTGALYRHRNGSGGGASAFGELDGDEKQSLGTEDLWPAAKRAKISNSAPAASNGGPVQPYVSSNDIRAAFMRAYPEWEGYTFELNGTHTSTWTVYTLQTCYESRTCFTRSQPCRANVIPAGDLARAEQTAWDVPCEPTIMFTEHEVKTVGFPGAWYIEKCSECDGGSLACDKCQSPRSALNTSFLSSSRRGSMASADGNKMSECEVEDCNDGRIPCDVCESEGNLLKSISVSVEFTTRSDREVLAPSEDSVGPVHELVPPPSEEMIVGAPAPVVFQEKSAHCKNMRDKCNELNIDCRLVPLARKLFVSHNFSQPNKRRIQQRQQVRIIPVLNITALVGGKRVRFWLYGGELRAHPAKLPSLWDRLSHRVTSSVSGLLRGAFKFATGSADENDDDES